MHLSLASTILQLIGMVVVSGILFVLLAGWPRGIDRIVVTTKGSSAYSASLDAVMRRATKQQIEAYRWAARGLEFESLASRYPDRTAREIIRGEVARSLRELPPRIAVLEVMQRQWAAVEAMLALVTIEATAFGLQRDMFGLQPTVTVRIRNASLLAYSCLAWKAELYLSDDAQPVATAMVSADFTNVAAWGKALSPGDAVIVTMPTRDDSEDAWLPADGRPAQAWNVKFVPVVDRALDLRGCPHVGGSLVARIDLAATQAALDLATLYQDI